MLLLELSETLFRNYQANKMLLLLLRILHSKFLCKSRLIQALPSYYEGYWEHKLLHQKV